MKRDMDLVREILLAIEGGQSSLQATAGLPGSDAEPAAVEYHVNLLRQAGLVEVMSTSLGGSYHFRGLTWEGHDFLDTVRDPEVWKRTKDGASKMGGWTFGLLKDLGTAYLKHVAKERLGLNL